MKRWGILILVCLLLGAVTTVAVAWGIVCLASVSAAPSISSYLAADTREQCWWDALYKDEGVWRQCEFIGPTQEEYLSGQDLYRVRAQLYPSLPGWSRFHEFKPVAQSRGLRDAREFGFLYWMTFTEDAVGFPLPALWRATLSEAVDPGSGAADSAQRWFGTLRVERSAQPKSNQADLGTLPLVPVWPGFAIDTGFWSLVWGAFCGAGISARRGWNRWRRRREGCCVSCGYSLIGNASGKCPECGTAIAPRRPFANIGGH